MSLRRLLASGRFWGALAIVATVLLGVAGWMLYEPGPMDFAGGRRVPLAAYSGPNPTGVPPELGQADRLTRGQYLTDAADCVACHTAEGGKPFAGGYAFNLPYGTIYSPNITPDRQTGIGDWSDADFLRALHQGVARDGEHLYPAFPYDSYTYLADDDVLAIKAYLFSLPPVRNAVPESTLSFPYNQRWLLAAWSFLYNPDRRFEPNADRSPEWNRGAYVAEALAHCGDCHTPRNLAQGLDNRRKFSGALVTGWRAFNISSDRATGIGAWSDEDLEQYLSIGHAQRHGTAAGPMGEAVDNSLHRLLKSDVHAIVTYLRTVPPIATPGFPAPKMQPAPAAAKLGVAANVDPRGKHIFEGACVACHDWTGAGALTPFATLTGATAVNDPSAVNVVQIVLNGMRRPTLGATAFMPAFGGAYSDSEIAAVANYVTARFGSVPSRVTSSEVADLRRPKGN
jgi:mono/diheme cytochrome c family protein